MINVLAVHCILFLAVSTIPAILWRLAQSLLYVYLINTALNVLW